MRAMYQQMLSRQEPCTICILAGQSSSYASMLNTYSQPQNPFIFFFIPILCLNYNIDLKI